MTKEEFQSLSPEDQESFINNGGSIDLPVELVNSSTSSASDGFYSSPSHTTQQVLSDNAQSQEGESQSSYTLSRDDSDYMRSSQKTDFNFDGIKIENPIELLLLIDEDIKRGKANGGIDLHDWQVQIMLDFANGDRKDSQPFQAVVRACNGSGKDKYIIASCACWLAMRYKFTRVVITSASGQQLDNQTLLFLRMFMNDINRVFGIELWETKYREYTCNFGDGTFSKIFAYATDEETKAEGYHPLRAGAKMGIITSEDKSIADNINGALNRCTGYTHRLHVSSPGPKKGHFYDYCNIAINRPDIADIWSLKPTDWIHYHVRGSMCSHLNESYFKQMERDLPGGKLGAAYQSQVEAEFHDSEEMTVIPHSYVWRAMNRKFIEENIKWIPEPNNTGGLDLSDGGAECVFTVRNGNKLLKLIPFRFDDTEDTVEFLDKSFRDNGFLNKNALIYADSIGIGKPILDRLRRMGWTNIRYIDSRNTAKYPKTYKNRGAELFFNFRKLLEHNKVILLDDDLTLKQLSSRHYKLVGGCIHQLLSKIEERSKGYESPDRADSINLCYWNYQTEFIEQDDEYKPPFEVEKEEEIVPHYDHRYAVTDKQKPWKAKEQKDFSYLQEEINDYNMKQTMLN